MPAPPLSPGRPRSPLLAYATAVALVAAALVLDLAVWPFLDLPGGSFFFAAAVAWSAYQGGVRAGLLAAGLAALASDFFFVPPLLSLGLGQPGSLYAFCLMLAEGVLLSVLAASLHRPPPAHLRGRPEAYAAAAGWVAVALLIKLLLRSGVPTAPGSLPDMPFTLFYAAVLVSAWQGGLGPGLFATALATGAAGYFFIEPHAASWISGPAEVVLLGLFDLEAGSIVLLGASVHTAWGRARESAREARRHEARFQESERRYQRLVEGVRDHALFLLDAAGRVATWDAGAERVLGYPAAEAAGLPFRTFSTPEDVAAGRPEEELRAAAAGGRYEGTGWRVRKGGQRFWAEVYLAAAGGSEGDPPGFSVVLRDVSERQRLEEQLRQAQKMEAVGRLAGGVAHDFNNLLTAVLGYSQLLLARMPAGDPLRGDLVEIIAVGERTAQLTRQLLTISRRQATEPRVFDLNDVVGRMCKVLQRLVGEDIDLVAVPAAGLYPVRADPGHLEQVLLNLAVNARDAMPKGGRLTVETANVDLDEAAARARPGVRPGPHVVLTVKDTGVGMTEEVKAHLFEPFFTTKEPGKGTGLGLATAYGIVRQAGGHIEVESAPGAGALFTVYLPAAAGAASAAPAAAARESPRGSETVLLVEDEDYLRSLFRSMLQAAGYRVLEARGADEAAGVCARHAGPLDLLVTDVVLPGPSGPDLAARLAGLRPGLKVLFISGYPEEAVRGHGLADPGAAFLQKPFAPDALARKVREVLDGR